MNTQALSVASAWVLHSLGRPSDAARVKARLANRTPAAEGNRLNWSAFIGEPGTKTRAFLLGQLGFAGGLYTLTILLEHLPKAIREFNAMDARYIGPTAVLTALSALLLWSFRPNPRNSEAKIVLRGMAALVALQWAQRLASPSWLMKPTPGLFLLTVLVMIGSLIAHFLGDIVIGSLSRKTSDVFELKRGKEIERIGRISGGPVINLLMAGATYLGLSLGTGMPTGPTFSMAGLLNEWFIWNFGTAVGALLPIYPYAGGGLLIRELLALMRKARDERSDKIPLGADPDSLLGRWYGRIPEGAVWLPLRILVGGILISFVETLTHFTLRLPSVLQFLWRHYRTARDGRSEGGSLAQYAYSFWLDVGLAVEMLRDEFRRTHENALYVGRQRRWVTEESSPSLHDWRELQSHMDHLADRIARPFLLWIPLVPLVVGAGVIVSFLVVLFHAPPEMAYPYLQMALLSMALPTLHSGLLHSSNNITAILSSDARKPLAIGASTEDHSSEVSGGSISMGLLWWNLQKVAYWLQSTVQRARHRTLSSNQRLEKIALLHLRAHRSILLSQSLKESLRWILQDGVYVPTEAEAGKELIIRLHQQGILGPSKMFVDLGCGDGIMVHLANAITGAFSVGIDRNPVLIAYAKSLTSILNRFGAVDEHTIWWIEGDFSSRQSDVAEADVLYLWSSKLDFQLEQKIIFQMKPGAILITRGAGMDHASAERLDLGITADGPYKGLPFTGYRRKAGPSNSFNPPMPRQGDVHHRKMPLGDGLDDNWDSVLYPWESPYVSRRAKATSLRRAA